jgi:hypothetical protein
MTLDLLRLPCLVVLFLCLPFGLGASLCNTLQFSSGAKSDNSLVEACPLLSGCSLALHW